MIKAFTKNYFQYNSQITIAIIAIVSFLLYGNTLNHEYTQDDAIVIYDNMFTTQGMQGIPGLLTNDTFYGFFKEEGKAQLVSGGRYRPLTPIMFAIEYEIFGNQPFIGHLFNVIWYFLLGIVLFFTIKLLLSNVFDAQQSVIFSLIATLLYLAHPLHTEVVANIKGRDEIMAMLGSLLVLMLSLKYNKTIFQKLTIGFIFFIACLSKENAITFLAIIPLSSILFFNSNLKKAILDTIPAILGFIIFLVIRTSVLGWDFGGTPMELMNNPYLKFVSNQYIPFSSSEKISTIAVTLLKYIQLLFFPIVLTHDYYPRHIEIASLSQFLPWISFVTYLSLSLLALFWFKNKKVLAFSIIYFLATLSIISNVFFPVGTNMSERFMFMPSLGFILALTYLYQKISFKRQSIFFLISALTFVLYSYKTINRNKVWVNDFTLFTTDVKTSNNSAKVLNAAGGALTTQAFEEKDDKKKTEMLSLAISYLDKATKIHPSYKNAYLIKGNAYYFLNDYENAIKNYSLALQIDPNYSDAEKNLAISLRDNGRKAGEVERDLEKSIGLLNRSLEFSKTDVETYRLLGIAHGIKGDHNKAIFYFQKAIELNPNNAGSYLNLSNAYNYTGDIENARNMMDKALSLDPNINK